MAIRDWPLKREMIRVLLEAKSHSDIANIIFDDNVEYGYDIENLKQHINTRWIKNSTVTKKSKYFVFFQEVSQVLNCKELIKGHNLAIEPVGSFLNVLPNESLKTLKIALECREFEQSLVSEKLMHTLDNILKSRASSLSKKQDKNNGHSSKSWNQIYHLTGVNKETIHDGFDKLCLDQSLFYLHPESVRIWEEITTDPLYDGFDDCLNSLKKFVKSNTWQNFVSEKRYSGNVMLTGGGAPEKDKLILSSIMKYIDFPSSKFTHSIIDTSTFMLQASINGLSNYFNAYPIAREYFKVTYLESDVFKLSDLEWLRHEKGQIAWFIPGGTVGNLNEEGLFEKLNQICMPNDLLTVGAFGYIEQEDTDKLKLELKREYQSETVKELLRIPLLSICGAVGLRNGLMEELMDSWKVELNEQIDNVALNKSIEPNVSVTLDDDNKLTLFKSTRYNFDQLISYIENSGWKSIDSFEGVTNKYRQLVFKKL